MKLLIPLFSPATGTWGGLTRVIAVAKAAQEAGHSVAFCASGTLEASLKQRGFRVYSTPSTTFLGLPAPFSKGIEQRSQNTALPIRPGRDFGNIWFVLLISGMGQSAYLKQLVAAELRAAQDFKAQAIFTDLDPGAYLLSQITGLPVTTAYQTPMAQGVGTLPWKLINRAVLGVQKAYHLPSLPVESLFHGPRVLKIIPSIPELEGTDPHHPDVAYVGQLLGDIQPGSDFQPEPGKSYVFVYMGTGAVPLDKLRAVLPAVFPSGGKHICLVGAQSLAAVERTGAVEFRPYIPASSLLPYCDWTICHGGQNTIIQSLLNGVPLIVFPGPIFERRFNARKVQEAGAGCMYELNEFTSASLAQSIASQPDFCNRAQELSARIRAYGGAHAAVTAIEHWS